MREYKAGPDSLSERHFRFTHPQTALQQKNKYPLTKLVRGREGSLQPVVLDHWAASFWVAHRPHIGHTQGVAAILTADVLQHKKTEETLKLAPG